MGLAVEGAADDPLGGADGEVGELLPELGDGGVPLHLDLAAGAGQQLLRLLAGLGAGLLLDAGRHLLCLGDHGLGLLPRPVQLRLHLLLGLGQAPLGLLGGLQPLLDAPTPLVQQPQHRLVGQEVEHHQQDGEVDELGQQAGQVDTQGLQPLGDAGQEGHRLTPPGLEHEADHDGSDQGVDADGLGEGQPQDHVGLDSRLGLGVAAQGLHGPAHQVADGQRRGHRAQAHGQTGRQEAQTLVGDGEVGLLLGGGPQGLHHRRQNGQQQVHGTPPQRGVWTATAVASAP